MQEISLKGFKGLSSYQLKIIALITMTIDHLGAYGFEIPLFGDYKEYLRIIGRIAAPLFLFVITESVRYTQSKSRFLLRLYLGAVGVGLFVTITNFLFEDTIGRFRQSNILYTYFYTALYIVLIENIISSVKLHNLRKGLLSVAGIIATVIPHFISDFIWNLPFEKYSMAPNHVWTLLDFAESIFKSPLTVEYTPLFIIMGIIMYFIKNKYGKAAILLLFSGICYFGSDIEFLRNSVFAAALGYPQYYMALAIPFILLYNGKKGTGMKYFFYLYYPLHRYAISIAAFIYMHLALRP